MVGTRKAEELEIVELTEDLPKYGLKRGERGVVITAFDEPDEAYDLEFVDESGTSSRFAYSVRPEQIRNIDAIAKEAFSRGMELLNSGLMERSQSEFREAIALKPRYIGILNNLFGEAYRDSGDWEALIVATRFLIRLDSSYAIVWKNLAIAHLNYGVQLAKTGRVEDAISLFLRALTIPSSAEIAEDIRSNLAAAHTTLGIRAHEAGKLNEACAHMLQACAFQPNEVTRRNLGLAYSLQAEALMAEQRFAEAVAFFERSQDAGFVSPESLNNYGLALARQSRFSEATSAFEMALRLTPGDDLVLANLRSARQERTIDLKAYDLPADFDHGPPFHSQRCQTSA